jgi:DNA polymerase III epsilon subunit-like protein
MSKKPRIIAYDIETAHNIVASFSLWNKYGPIPFENIIQEGYIICASWMVLGEGGIQSVSVLDNLERPITDDYEVVAKLHEVLSNADAIVAHYGDEFDIKKINARLIYHGFTPLPSIIQIDTKKIAKKKFLLNSYKLDYIAQYLGVGKKMDTPKGLWLRCLRGDEDSIQQMVRYNRQDVVILVKVYKKLAPFVPPSMSYRAYTDRDVCGNCGSKVQYRGYAYTKTNKYKRFQCTKCGNWGKSNKAE